MCRETADRSLSPRRLVRNFLAGNGGGLPGRRLRGRFELLLWGWIEKTTTPSRSS